MESKNDDIKVDINNLQQRRKHLLLQLGESLYEQTKTNEEYYLLAPDLYLEIAKIDQQLHDTV